MLPLAIETRLSQPAMIENNLINYFTLAQLPINQSKSIAYQSLYHQKNVGGRTQAQFFTGTFENENTNIDTGSFVRPQSEHFLIYGIKVWDAVYTPPEGGTNFPQLLKGAYSADNNAGAGEIDASIANATYDVIINGIRVIKAMPLIYHDNTLVTGQRGEISLSQPLIWMGQSELQLNVSCNSTTNPFPDASTEFETALRFELIGIGLI